MATNMIKVELPVSAYEQLQELAAVEQKDPIEVITELIDMAHQRQSWLRELEELRDLIREQGGLQISTNKEEMIEQLRQTRREIFEAEYAHLYR
jgi:small-conductance mechanosensitive channel